MTSLRAFAEFLDRQLWLRRNRPRPCAPGERQRLLVDVSAIIRHDAQTGIQRVVRSVWSELSRRSGDAFECVPVFATSRHGYCVAPEDFLIRHRTPTTSPQVEVMTGDKFLGLDLSAHLLPKYRRQLRSWRQAGASIHLVVYDLLPLSRPEWFNTTTSLHFRNWFRVLVEDADQAICISDQVADELRERVRGTRAEGQLAVGRMPMGADIAQSVPSRGVCETVRNVLARMRFRPTILMVGTVEPRKGYDVALAAFEFLWRTSPTQAPDLVIVGKGGWKTTKLQHAIRSHPLFGRRLHWLEGVSDEALCDCYEASRGLLVASRAEGFGLPLIEAAEHRLPVLARDLKVFREHNLPNVAFFSDEQPQALARQLVDLAMTPKRIEPARLNSWRYSVDRLLEEMGIAPTTVSRNPVKVRDAS